MDRFRVAIDKVLLPENVVAGCNPLQLMFFAYSLRATNEDLDPVIVRPWRIDSNEGKFYKLVDGRHRFIAAVIAGRKDVLAVFDEAGAR